MSLPNRSAPLRAALVGATLLGPVLLSAGLAGCSQAHITSTEPKPPPSTDQLATPSGLIKLGDDVRRQGDANGALAIYQAASSQDSHDPSALARIGSVSIDLGQPLRAEQAYRAILAADPQNTEARFGLGLSLLGQQKVNDALPILGSLAQDSSDMRRLRGYAVALDMAGRPAEAQRYYRIALAKAPTDADLHGDLALSLAAAGDSAAALAESDRAVASVLPDTHQRANNVLLLAMAGQTDEARKRGLQWLGADQTEAVIKQAALVQQATDPASRAKALGLMSAPPTQVVAAQ